MSNSYDTTVDHPIKKRKYQIDPCKGCMEKLSQMEIPDINALNDCCYDMTARATGAQSVNQIRGTELVDNAADCIHKAMHNMGRSPCNFKLSSPPIFVPNTPNLFLDMGNGLSPDEALESCLSKCYPSNSCGAPSMSCIDDCLLQRSCVVDAQNDSDLECDENIYDPKYNLPLTEPQNFFPPMTDYKSPTCGVNVDCKENFNSSQSKLPSHSHIPSSTHSSTPSSTHSSTPSSTHSSIPRCNAPKNVRTCKCGGQTFLDDDGCPLVQCLACGSGSPVPDHCSKLDASTEDCECGGIITKDKSGCPLVECNDCEIIKSGLKRYMVAHPASFTIGIVATIILTGLVFVCAVYVIFRKTKKS